MILVCWEVVIWCELLDEVFMLSLFFFELLVILIEVCWGVVFKDVFLMFCENCCWGLLRLVELYKWLLELKVVFCWVEDFWFCDEICCWRLLILVELYKWLLKMVGFVISFWKLKFECNLFRLL